MNQQERIGAAISLSHAAAEVMSMSGRGTFMHNLGERLAAVAREQLDIASPPAEKEKVVAPAAEALDVGAFKQYTCHKQVHATPMNRGDYNHARGWSMPPDENGEDPGYLIVYNAGTADEYVSWSPKHIFDEGYSEAKVLTDADALADLNGEPHQDNHSR